MSKAIKFTKSNKSVTIPETRPKVKKLWSGRLSTNGTTVNLTDSRKNYDFILFIGCGDTGAKARPVGSLISNSAINDSSSTYITIIVPYTSGDDIILHFSFPTDTTLKSLSSFTNYFVLTEVWGIKIY